MLAISLDEGAVFDILAINVVKNIRRPSENLKKVITITVDEIKKQIGEEKTESILHSEEFKELVSINDLVFDLIDEAHYAIGLAKDVQDGNFKRYTQKILLQKKFFGSDATEEKM